MQAINGKRDYPAQDPASNPAPVVMGRPEYRITESNVTMMLRYRAMPLCGVAVNGKPERRAFVRAALCQAAALHVALREAEDRETVALGFRDYVRARDLSEERRGVKKRYLAALDRAVKGGA